EPEEGLVPVLGEVEHLDVAVGVAGGEHGSSSDAGPDVHRLLRPVVQVVHGRLAGDHTAELAGGVRERDRAADDAVPGDAVDLLADRSHEVAATAGGDVVG